MSDPDALAQQIRELTQRGRKAADGQAWLAVLQELLDLYDHLSKQQEAAAPQVRQAFLQVLGHSPRDLVDLQKSQHVTCFLAEQVEPEDFLGLTWQTPDQVLTYCELLYSFPFENDTQAEHIRAHVRTLLTQALLVFERQGDLEKLFTLLQLAPATSMLEDHELQRLHSRAYVYEQRRVQRTRRLLYGYLLVQALLIVLVFPLLFINAENGALQDQIEQAAGVELAEEGRRYFRYSDGLYWALITAASIGYGDITPQTNVGRIIAATLGVFGVVTVGVIAGLILNWISPRILD
jgi:hypothetical protein